MWEAFTIYGHDTQHKAEYYEYDVLTNTYNPSPIEFWFAYVSNSEETELIQPLEGFYTNSTGNTIYVDGQLEISFKENDKITIDGSENMIVRIETPRTNKKGLRTFDFQPSDMVRRVLILS